MSDNQIYIYNVGHYCKTNQMFFTEFGHLCVCVFYCTTCMTKLYCKLLCPTRKMCFSFLRSCYFVCLIKDICVYCIDPKPQFCNQTFCKRCLMLF